MMSSRESGFTLLEILVVLVILGLGLALIVAMTTNASRYSERVEEETYVQLTCENMMNSILAGNMVATIGVELPIPDAPSWSTTVELLDGPIENLVAIRITAQRDATIEVPSPTDPSAVVTLREPELGRVFVVKEWARRAEIKTRVVTQSSTGDLIANDSTADQDWNPLGQGALGGGLESVPNETFNSFEQLDSLFNEQNVFAP